MYLQRTGLTMNVGLQRFNFEVPILNTERHVKFLTLSLGYDELILNPWRQKFSMPSLFMMAPHCSIGIRPAFQVLTGTKLIIFDNIENPEAI